MAQQTINVGAAPNDGTGTPLRTAFQYTNSNFTELYTATGPSGNNIVVPGSATITGDLTVDTSTLKVDSANDRVGFGTASPAQFVHFSKSNTSTALTSPPVGNASLRIQNTSSTNNNFGSVEFYNAAGLFGASVNCQYTNQATPTNDLVFVTRGSSGGLEHYRIAADGVATWSEVGGVAGTAMTLNSTGLGVGVSPVEKLTVAGRGLFVSANPDNAALKLEASTGTNSVAINFANTGGNYFVGVDNSVGGRLYGVPYSLCIGSTGAYPVVIATNNTARLTVDSSGNVGIGVTPSAAIANNRKLEIVGLINSAVVLGSNSVNAATRNWAVASSWNSYGDLVFLQSNALGGDPLASGAGTTRMTLDASGNLLVGKPSGVNKIETVGAGVDGSASVSGVSTVATTIYAIKQNATAAMCVVFGDDGLSGFCDIVLFLATVAPKVVSSQTLYGAPAARTYTTVSANLQLALASGTLSIRTAALSTLNT